MGVNETIRIVPIAAVPAGAVEQLLDRAFGADRRARTAYRIRTGMAAIASLSFAAVDADGVLLGTIQCWPVALHPADGPSVPMVMLGPVAVDPAVQRGGIGQALTRAALDAADDGGVEAMMLIGDPEYYGRFFGFTADRTAGWQAPGPVDRHRLLARGDAVPGGDGMLGPRAHAPA